MKENRYDPPMNESLNFIEQDPDSPAEASVIWMHGLGATAHDFESVPPELGLPSSAAIRFIFPQAPSIPVTLNGGMVMPAWYDIHTLGNRSAIQNRERDEAGIVRTRADFREPDRVAFDE